jgi:hypothetical protein
MRPARFFLSSTSPEIMPPRVYLYTSLHATRSHTATCLLTHANTSQSDASAFCTFSAMSRKGSHAPLSPFVARPSSFLYHHYAVMSSLLFPRFFFPFSASVSFRRLRHTDGSLCSYIHTYTICEPRSSLSSAFGFFATVTFSSRPFFGHGSERRDVIYAMDVQRHSDL